MLSQTSDVDGERCFGSLQRLPCHRMPSNHDCPWLLGCRSMSSSSTITLCILSCAPPSLPAAWRPEHEQQQHSALALHPAVMLLTFGCIAALVCALRLCLLSCVPFLVTNPRLRCFVLPSLNFLDLGLNGIADLGATALAQALHANTTLRHLALARNQLSPVAHRLLAVALHSRPVGHCRGEGWHSVVRVTGLDANDYEARLQLRGILSHADAERLLALRSPLDFVPPPT